MRRVVIVGPPPVQILDVAGPHEVFSSVPDYELILAAPGSGSVLDTQHGLSLGHTRPLPDAREAIDTLIVAGGAGAEAQEPNRELVRWLADVAPRCRRVAAICTGAFVLAEAGLLDGRQAVTHWNFCLRLAAQYPRVHVVADPIFLKDGNVYTSAGITAGIDLSLALVEEDHGHATAVAIAKHLVMFLVRPGGQAQFSQLLRSQFASSPTMRELQVWIQEHLRSNLTVEVLAERANLSSRQFARRCLSETGLSPSALVEQLRVQTAQRSIDSTDKGLKEIADECGFRSAEVLRRAFLRTLGISASEYAKRFRRRAS